MDPIPLPDKHYLKAAEGWIELGDAESAARELEGISAVLQGHPDVLHLRWHIHAKKKDWPACLRISNSLSQLLPDRPEVWVIHANTLYFNTLTEDAYKTLLPQLDRFPENEVMRYNMACYTCQLGRISEAREWLTKSIALGDAQVIKRRALDDQDLQPMWGMIREL